jgi:hypothetical protein
MELMTLIWIVVVALAVVHGLVCAFRPRVGAIQPRREITPSTSEDKEDENLGAVEDIARIRSGVGWLPKGTRVWMSVHDSHD